MIEANPDVPNTLAHIVHKGTPAGAGFGRTHGKLLNAGLRAQNSRAGAFAGLQVQEAAMLGVQVGKQAVLDLQRFVGGLGWTHRIQRQDRVGAVGVAVDLLRPHTQHAALPTHAQGQAC